MLCRVMCLGPRRRELAFEPEFDDPTKRRYSVLRESGRSTISRIVQDWSTTQAFMSNPEGFRGKEIWSVVGTAGSWESNLGR